jgi:hypothetical protein
VGLPSLALVRPRTVDGLEVEVHPGWTRAEQSKIDAYVGQLELFGTQDPTPLEAPRFRAAYRYRCHEPGCGGHRQGCIDWELVAFERHLRGVSDGELCSAIRDKFLGELCAPARDVAFFVGNQAERAHVFSVLGVRRPPRGDALSRLGQHQIAVTTVLVGLKAQHRHSFLARRPGDGIQSLDRLRPAEKFLVSETGLFPLGVAAAETGAVRLRVS